MAYLSRDDLDSFAERILCDFVKAEYPMGHICYNVDPTRLAQFYGYNILYVTITREGSILGQTSTGKMWTSVIDPNGNDVLFFLDGKTILIDERLGQDPKCYGRRNFTIAHELAHQFINRAYPEIYGTQSRLVCDYRRSVEHKQVSDWREWQADAMAAALLLPRQAIEEAMFFFGLGESP